MNASDDKNESKAASEEPEMQNERKNGLTFDSVRRNIDWLVVKNSKWNQWRTELTLPLKNNSVKIVF